MTVGKITPEKVFEELVRAGLYAGYAIGSPHGRLLQEALERGEDIPDKCLPGRLVMKLSDAERKVLRKLKPEMTNHRIWT